MKNIKKVLIVAVSAFILCLLATGTYVFIQYQKYAEDFSKLKSASYDTVFFSMYPIENYDEADYTFFRGMNIVKSSAVISNSMILKKYMDIAAGTENIISTVYLGIDPVVTDAEDIFRITLENPDKMFEIVLAYPEIDYWLSMEEEECRKVWEKYRDLAGNVLGLENVRVYYFCNEEWLLCNPGNYEDTFLTNEAVSEILMCYSDYLHNNILDVNNFHERFDSAWELIARYRETPVDYPDLSETEIIFFGDSVIGNYTNSLSIPGVINGITGAAVFNCGYGGRSAAYGPKTSEPAPEIVRAFIERDLSGIPKESQAYAGIEDYLQTGEKDKEKVFVFNYGLNDYFEGLPIRSEDIYDISSYCGAKRTAVCALKEAYAEAEILLLTPNQTIAYDYGKEIRSEQGGILQEYVDALIVLAEELDVKVLDNYRQLPINMEKHWELLADGTHPNEQGRFLIGTRIAEAFD